MARPYTVNITNGEGTANILSGDYGITANVNGYDNTTITPSTVEVDKTTETYNFTISATGTFTVHVSEEGTAAGTPVVGATFIRCDSTENEYGTAVTTNESGVATFNNIPYNVENSPTIYFKQKTSDGNHEYDSTLKNILSDSQTVNLEVQNTLPLQRTINLTELNYENLPIESGSITLS